MCGFVIKILKYEKRRKKTERKKESNFGHWKIQDTQIAIFVFDWLIIVLVF